MKKSYVKRIVAIQTGTGMHAVVKRRTLLGQGEERRWLMVTRHYTAVTAASFARCQRAQEVTA